MHRDLIMKTIILGTMNNIQKRNKMKERIIL